MLKITKELFCVAGLLVVSLPCVAEELLKTTTSWEGGDFHYLEGKPEITSLKLALKEGETTKYHCHPVPTFGYILKGHVEVETPGGKKTILHEGSSVVEMMGKVHRGTAVDGPVEIIVFYAGVEGVPTTVLPDSELGKAHCH